MMVDTIINAIGAVLSSLIGVLLMPIAGFIVGFFPDADTSIVSTIEGFGNVIAGDGLSFNYFYFCDYAIVSVFFTVYVVCMLAYLAYWLFNKVVELVGRIVEMIPVIE